MIENLEKLKRLADEGDSEAMVCLAYFHLHGVDVEKSVEKAVEYYTEAAKLGNSSAFTNLGICYIEGNGVEQSYEKAVEHFQIAAEMSCCTALFNLGLSYQQGKGVEASPEKAADCFQKAAVLGDVDSMVNMALCYQRGDGVKKSNKKALEYLYMAEENGDLEAIFNIALCYEYGKGVEQSSAKAVEYYEKASEKGHCRSVYNLAVHYQDGDGVECLPEKAFELLKSIYDQNDIKALFNLALCYRDGHGCVKNQGESEKLFQKLYDDGLNLALRYLPHPSLTNYVYPALEENGANEEDIETIKQAFATFQEAIIDVMDSCKSLDGETVYHFTRWPAIESILPKEKAIDRNVIRLYHVDYMNDPSEGMAFHTMINNGQFDPELVDIAHFMKGVLEQRVDLTQDAATYLASFTKAFDRLDLWRAYGSDGHGFCLKMSSREIDTHIWSQCKLRTNAESVERQVGSQQYQLYNVRYDDIDKDETLRNLLTALKPLHETVIKLPEAVAIEVKKTLFYMMGEVVYLFKDEQYSSEKEVRMFQRLSLDEVDIDESDIGKLYTTTSPILFTDEGSEIMIGPKVENRRLVELSLLKRLQVNGYHNTKITHSKVMYR
ncbi:DUF2971 domain-containing protein [Vibrio campbellii]|uniref:DUF2971 domain-containing protein n=1 Tax=Vibrio campbellii TaxID=680 RepID=UPI003D6B63E3